jgi:hypothetical protein
VPLRDAITRHWPLKLAALALSVILWVVIAAEETATQLVDIQLDLALAPDVALAQPLPPIKALVSGTGREMFKLYATPLVIRAAISESGLGSEARHRLAISPSDVQIPRNVRVSVQEIQPHEIELVLDRRAQKTVAVRAVVEPESGYALDGPIVVAPAVVRVSGARSLLGTLDSVATEPLDLRGVAGAFERSVTLDTTGRAVLQMVPPSVTLSGKTKKS